MKNSSLAVRRTLLSQCERARALIPTEPTARAARGAPLGGRAAPRSRDLATRDEGSVRGGVRHAAVGPASHNSFTPSSWQAVPSSIGERTNTHTPPPHTPPVLLERASERARHSLLAHLEQDAEEEEGGRARGGSIVDRSGQGGAAIRTRHVTFSSFRRFSLRAGGVRATLSHSRPLVIIRRRFVDSSHLEQEADAPRHILVISSSFVVSSILTSSRRQTPSSAPSHVRPSGARTERASRRTRFSACLHASLERELLAHFFCFVHRRLPHVCQCGAAHWAGV